MFTNDWQSNQDLVLTSVASIIQSADTDIHTMANTDNQSDIYIYQNSTTLL